MFEELADLAVRLTTLPEMVAVTGELEIFSPVASADAICALLLFPVWL